MVLDPSLDAPFQQLRELRPKLLKLHKALLDSERATYEQVYGRIQTSGAFLQLVINHEWFNWLRPISQFIVQIDEILHSKEPVVLSQVTDLLEKAQTLLQPAEEGTPAEIRYFQAIQRDPEIAMMHGEIARLLASNS
jgi:hypothetical protein